MNFRSLLEYIWPILEPLNTQQKLALANRENADREQLAVTNWTRHPEVAVEEARRLADAEAQRRQSADAKASTYLAVVAALVPILLTVATVVWEEKAGPAPTWVNMVGLAFATAYTSWAGLWAFRTLEVAVVNRVDVGDVLRAWKRPDPRPTLVRHTLWAARLNRDPVNRKVSCIRMAHAFLLRAFLTSTILLSFNILWYLGAALTDAVSETAPWDAAVEVWRRVNP